MNHAKVRKVEESPIYIRGRMTRFLNFAHKYQIRENNHILDKIPVQIWKMSSRSDLKKWSVKLSPICMFSRKRPSQVDNHVFCHI